MSRATLILNHPSQRDLAVSWIEKAPQGCRVEFKRPKRTLDQNSKLWASLTEVAMQVTWHGIKLTPDDWKLIFLDALAREKKQELRMVPNTDGTGVVNLGRSSSDLSKDEMSELIELIHAFGAKHDIQFKDTGALPSPVQSANEPALAGDGLAPGSSPVTHHKDAR
jgi:hypothetical protein